MATNMKRKSFDFFPLFMIGLGLFMVVCFLGMEDAACGMHVLAVEQLRADTHDLSAYRGSYATCHVVTRALDPIFN